MNKETATEIIEDLIKMYPDAKCSLDFNTPFQMLFAVVLSAQCTDERVNKVTAPIFEKYKTAEDMSEELRKALPDMDEMRKLLTDDSDI